MNTNDLLKQGVAALKAGQKAKAYRLLKKVTQQDKDNETAWLWMSGAVNTDRERIRCLREVLRIKPDNSDARRGLEHLEAKTSTTRPAKPKRKSKKPVVFLVLAVLVACAVMCAWMKADIDKQISEMPPPPMNTPTPERTTTEADIRSDLEWVLRDYSQVTLGGVSIVGRQLVVEVSLDRTSGEAFFAALGAIHGTIAEIEPDDVDTVMVKDITGQRITVKMSELLAHYYDRTTFDEFRDTWEIVNP